MEFSDLSIGALDDDALDVLLQEAGFAQEQLQGRLQPRGHARPVPLSFGQELLWSLDQAVPGLSAYNNPIARRLRGALNLAALQKSLDEVVGRHEILRTRFLLVDGHPLQLADPVAACRYTIVDLRERPAVEREEELRQTVRNASRKAFDLQNETPFRATLVRVADDDAVLLLETHHIACDGWSNGILLREIFEAYRAFVRGERPQFPVLPVQYLDYAVWERERISGPALERVLTYWRTELAECTESLALPTDHPRSAMPTFTGTQRSVLIEPLWVEQLKKLGQPLNATLHMMVLAAFAVVLHRYTARLNIVIGTNVAAREDSALEGMIGYFNKTLPLRINFAQNPSYAEVVRQVRRASLDAYEHQEIPLEQLALDLRESRPEVARAQLFDVVLTSQIAASGQSAPDGLDIETYGVDLGGTKFDYTLFVSETEQGMSLSLRARSDLWRIDSIERTLGHLRQILLHALKDAAAPVSAVPMLTLQEIAELTDQTQPRPATSLVSLLEHVAAVVKRTPARIALRCGQVQCTYAEMWHRASLLAQRWEQQGLRRGSRIAILLDRSVEAVIAVIATWMLEAAYVPLSPEESRMRIEQRIAQAGCSLVTTSAAYQHLVQGLSMISLIDDSDDRENRELIGRDVSGISVDLGDPAYILFTSGTTGLPKGVAVTQGNIAHYVAAITRIITGKTVDLTIEDNDIRLDQRHFGVVSTFAADLGYTTLFTSLCTGGTLHIFPADIATDAQRYLAYVREQPLDVLKITPGHLQALLAAVDPADACALLPTEIVLLGGERLPWELVHQVRAIAEHARQACCRIVNHYGPTETTVGACTYEVPQENESTRLPIGTQSVPIGTPIQGMKAFACDAQKNLMPIGIPGELYLAGAGVAQGYINDQQLTEERFVRFPDGSRMYRTGDFVRRLPDGNLEFLDRIDQQVKIRGFRVELGEIETALRLNPDVKQVRVLALAPNETAEKVVVAYFVPRSGAVRMREILQEQLPGILPAYACPAAYVELESLPLTTNGKLDVRRLPDPFAQASVAEYVAPTSDVETRLASLWAEAFKCEPTSIGTQTHFFDLGGNSLLAIRLLGKVAREFNVRVPLRILFERPVLRDFAAHLAEKQAAGKTTPDGDTIVAIPRAAYRVRKAGP